MTARRIHEVDGHLGGAVALEETRIAFKEDEH